MSVVDHTKVVYYSGFNSFKNIGVYDAVVSVDGSSIASGAVKTWSTSINVEPNSDFATIQVQANEQQGFGPGTPTPLRWQSYPATRYISLELNTDPDNNGTLYADIIVFINATQVTFTINLFNGTGSTVSCVPIDVGFKYAIHSTER